MQNQRKHPRSASKIPARIEFSWGALDGTIENIGQGGAFFATDTLEGSVAEGDPVEMVFSPPDETDPARVRGTVLRIERYFHQGQVVRTLAIKFDEPLPSSPGTGGDGD